MIRNKGKEQQQDISICMQQETRHAYEYMHGAITVWLRIHIQYSVRNNRVIQNKGT